MSSAPKTNPDAAAKAAGVVPDDAQMRNTICPFLRSALKAGALEFDGRTASQAAVKDFLGGGPNGLGQIAKFFARRNHTNPDTPRGRFDPINLVGSRGSHPGDSRMLTAQGFDARRFEEFTAHARTAPDGRRYLTAEDFGAAIAEDIRRDPKSRIGPTDVLFNNDMRNSAGEFGLLLHGFGREMAEGPDRGQQVVYVDEMRQLFEQNRFAADWPATLKRASAFGCIRASFGLTGFGGIYGKVRKAYRALVRRQG
jgi:hypothetical protein